MSLKLWTTWEIEEPENAEAWEALFNKALEAALSEEKVSENVEIELNIVDDEAIHVMNKEYREVDRATDVLSFPMCEFDAGCAGEQMAAQMKDPENGCVMLGNIVLSWDHVLAQAEEYGHSIRREAVFLIIHSILHLLGYDHVESEDEAKMIEKQKKILDVLQITREA